MEQYFTTKTGVHVGRLWVNRTSAMPIEDPDMRRLQLALTLKPNQIRQRKLHFIYFWLVTAALIGIIALAVMFKSHLSYANENHYKQQHMLQFSNRLGESNE